MYVISYSSILNVSTFSSRARWFVVVVRPEVLAPGAEHVGITHMAGIVILLLIFLQQSLHFVHCAHRQGNGDEFAPLLRINTFGRSGYGSVFVFVHTDKDSAFGDKSVTFIVQNDAV